MAMVAQLLFGFLEGLNAFCLTLEKMLMGDVVGFRFIFLLLSVVFVLVRSIIFFYWCEKIFMHKFVEV